MLCLLRLLPNGAIGGADRTAVESIISAAIIDRWSGLFKVSIFYTTLRNMLVYHC